MSAYNRARIVVTIAIVSVFAILATVGVGSADQTGSPIEGAPGKRVCFPAAKWGPVPDQYRPCVRILRVQEDGSFGVSVSDGDGVERYTLGVGVPDRYEH